METNLRKVFSVPLQGDGSNVTMKWTLSDLEKMNKDVLVLMMKNYMRTRDVRALCSSSPKIHEICKEKRIIDHHLDRGRLWKFNLETQEAEQITDMPEAIVHIAAYAYEGKAYVLFLGSDGSVFAKNKRKILSNVKYLHYEIIRGLLFFIDENDTLFSINVTDILAMARPPGLYKSWWPCQDGRGGDGFSLPPTSVCVGAARD